MLPCARKGNELESGRLGGKAALERANQEVAISIVVGIGFNNLNMSLGGRAAFWPINGIKKNSKFLTRIGGGPKFGFTGGVIGVPSEEALPMT